MTPFGLGISSPQARFSGKVLFGRSERPLFVPDGDETFVRDAIRLFVHGNARRAWATIMLKLDRWLPPLRLLPTVKPMQLPLPDVYGELGIPQGSFAVYYGSPGPLRKLTVYTSGAERSVTKIALQPSADAMIRNEGKILALLADHQIGVDFVPRLLGHGRLSCGRRFLRTTVLPAGRRELRFGAMHCTFLTQLYAHRGCVRIWVHGHGYAALVTHLATIRNKLDRMTSELIDAVLADIVALSGNEPVAECVVHGDFVPWNITVTNDRLCVFDWEYAVACGNPLHDYLHFHLIPEVLLHRLPSSAMFNRLALHAGKHLACMAGHAPSPQLVGALMLQYLTQTVTFFCAADGELKYGHPIIKAYMQLLRNRHTWLPTGAVSGDHDDER